MRLVASVRRHLAPQPVRLGHVAVHREIVGGKVTPGSHSVQTDDVPEKPNGKNIERFWMWLVT
jgi:hypothetical protein